MKQHVLTSMLERSCDQRGSSTFVRYEGRAFSFQDFRRAVLELARLLRKEVVSGDRVVIVDSCALDSLELLFACSYLDVVFTIVDKTISAKSLRQIVADCQPRLICSPSSLHAVDRYRRGELGRLSVYRLEEVRHSPSDHDGQIVGIVYTSGSTGTQKGVALSHRNVEFSVNAILERLEYAADDVVAAYLPLSFDYGLYQVFLACTVGCTIALRDRAPTAALLVRALQSDGVSIFPSVPSLSSALAVALHSRHGATALGSLRKLTSTGQFFPPALIDALQSQLPDLHIYSMYGLTECKRVSILVPSEHLTRRGSVGRPLTGTRVYTIGDDGRVLGPGEVGQFVVEGEHVASYWSALPTDADIFAVNGERRVLYTGDYGHVDADGYLYWAGRRDGIVKRSSMRISLVEIENSLSELPTVASAVALLDELTEQIVAFVVPMGAADARRPEEPLMDALSAVLERHKLPDLIVPMNDIPLTSNGKVNRKKLLLDWRSSNARSATLEPPRPAIDTQTSEPGRTDNGRGTE